MMSSKHKQLHIPLTDEQHAALEQIALRLGTTKTRVIIEALKVHDEFNKAEDVHPRGKYQRKTSR